MGVGLCVFLLLGRLALAEPRGEANATLSGSVWHDANQNGLREPEEGPLAGALLLLADPQGSILAHTHTDSNGGYLFSAVAPGSYLLAWGGPRDYTPTTARVWPLTLAQASLRHDFGAAAVFSSCFRILDGTITRAADGAPLEEVAVRVMDLRGGVAALTLTDSEGGYTVRGLPAAQYLVAVRPASGMSCAQPLHWGIDLRGCLPTLIDLALQAEAGQASLGRGVWPYAPTVAPASLLLPAAALTSTNSVTGTVYLLEESGTRRPAAGVRLTLNDTSGQLVATQVSDAQGEYRFGALTAWRNYYLRQDPLPGYPPVVAAFWGVAINEDSQIIIDLENRRALTPTPPATSLYLPLINKPG
jgi:hypothetical protein